MKLAAEHVVWELVCLCLVMEQNGVSDRPETAGVITWFAACYTQHHSLFSSCVDKQKHSFLRQKFTLKDTL